MTAARWAGSGQLLALDEQRDPARLDAAVAEAERLTASCSSPAAKPAAGTTDTTTRSHLPNNYERYLKERADEQGQQR